MILLNYGMMDLLILLYFEFVDLLNDGLYLISLYMSIFINLIYLIIANFICVKYYFLK